MARVGTRQAHKVNIDIARLLAPYADAVQDAQAALDRANRSPNGLTVTYAAAGRLVAAYNAYTTALVNVIDRRDPGRAECQCEVDLAIQGRIRTLHEIRQKVHTN